MFIVYGNTSFCDPRCGLRSCDMLCLHATCRVIRWHVSIKGLALCSLTIFSAHRLLYGAYRQRSFSVLVSLEVGRFVFLRAYLSLSLSVCLLVCLLVRDHDRLYAFRYFHLLFFTSLVRYSLKHSLIFPMMRGSTRAILHGCVRRETNNMCLNVRLS